jgi:hypothetical protein
MLPVSTLFYTADKPTDAQSQIASVVLIVGLR